MEMKNLFKGLTLGEKQESGVMAVIPLLGEDASDNFTSFENIKFNGTQGYGNMGFTNHSDKNFIIPTGYSIITKQEAQDHGLPFASLLKPQQYRDINTACCIQSSQGGYISDQKKIEDFMIMPLYVRKGHFENYLNLQSNKSISHMTFSRLWDIISEFQKDLVGTSEAQLVFFFNKFMDKLTQFNAEFEVVENQRGAIIMLNNKIVGIEIAPTREYWKTVWNTLVRDCYGSEVIRLAMQNLVKEFKEQQKTELKLDDCKTVEEIKNRLKDFNTVNRVKVETELEKIIEKEVIVANDGQIIKDNSSDTVKYSIFKVKNEATYGEVYTENDNIVYCSILF